MEGEAHALPPPLPRGPAQSQETGAICPLMIVLDDMVIKF